jgi:hypothetical protein
MKIEIESYKKKYTIETEYDDVSLDEYFEFFKGLLISGGFHPISIDQYIIELASDLKEDPNEI